jgi:hypothetical protein
MAKFSVRAFGRRFVVEQGEVGGVKAGDLFEDARTRDVILITKAGRGVVPAWPENVDLEAVFAHTLRTDPYFLGTFIDGRLRFPLSDVEPFLRRVAEGELRRVDASEALQRAQRSV